MALKVIGAGLGRTGTLSLKLALEHLGFGPCHHMIEIMSASREHIPLWLEVVRGKPDWDAVYAGFSSTVDYPSCTYWRELADYYPDAKVILSTRDAEGWFDSVQRTIFSPQNLEKFKEGPIEEFMNGAVLGDFGDRIADRDFMVDYYRRREQDVIDTLPPERLLAHRSADGWEPLCAFLGVPVPAEPYPRVNTSEDMTQSGVIKTAGMSGEDAEAGARNYVEAMRTKAFGN